MSCIDGRIIDIVDDVTDVATIVQSKTLDGKVYDLVIGFVDAAAVAIVKAHQHIYLVGAKPFDVSQIS